MSDITVSQQARTFRYNNRPGEGRGWSVAATREEWLNAILTSRNRPKPPAWWIAQQSLEGRNPVQASIIWGKHYSAARKFTIWSEAPDEDFDAGGYR